ncbi:hypothetical protein [Micromonospora sp. M42]|uniref:hypothetical protein n=1 Tax=Micromonospora sp. M42 TaxID=457406 RepID=UPI0018DB50DA|nr:hypothetical protein [Micromonospora sp. M42]
MAIPTALRASATARSSSRGPPRQAVASASNARAKLSRWRLPMRRATMPASVASPMAVLSRPAWYATSVRASRS